MSYILKNTSGLVNTRFTDAARQKLSQGTFNISYFQVGDSEVVYNVLPTTYVQSNSMVLKPAFNAQNISGQPESNKGNVKYPYYVDGNGGNTYGIPYMDSVVSPVYNTAAMRGFFTGDTQSLPTNWSALTGNDYVLDSNYVVDMSSLNGSNILNVVNVTCNPDNNKVPQPGDFVTIYYDTEGHDNCSCSTLVPPITVECTMSMKSCVPILTYRVVDFCNDVLTLDRTTPDYTNITFINKFARVIFYPGNMTTIYDSVTPLDHFSDDVINFESICTQDQFNVKIWNMNIPWSESLAGINSATHKDFTQFGSIDYMGSKEYFGYMSNSGQTFFIDNLNNSASTDTYFYNSFDEKVMVEPEEQKSIAIIHYTNQTIDLFYGEKFALEPYDPSLPFDATGQARNFKLHLPWLMWHKNTEECCLGETFWVDPPGFEDLNLFEVHYMMSKKNIDMNEPGLRYYNLWDVHATADNGLPSRVGKVFPDDKIIIIDDDEIIAAMSYKSNRNWTLPAPKLFLSTPNTCNNIGSNEGVLTDATETMYITYRFTNNTNFTNSLHSNYYVKIVGPSDCNQSNSENVGVRFGPYFNCLKPYDNTFKEGFFGETIEILCQKVTTGDRPLSNQWRVIDVTNQINSGIVNGYLTEDALTDNTFVITKALYDAAPYYDLSQYIQITPQGDNSVQLNFGDEYYFYGALETDIQATIYEMRYKVNLSDTEFKVSSNPTWDSTKKPHMTEIGLYDSDKTLMIVSKLQSPVLRQGIQQFLIKFDF